MKKNQKISFISLVVLIALFSFSIKVVQAQKLTNYMWQLQNPCVAATSGIMYFSTDSVHYTEKNMQTGQSSSMIGTYSFSGNIITIYAIGFAPTNYTFVWFSPNKFALCTGDICNIFGKFGTYEDQYMKNLLNNMVPPCGNGAGYKVDEPYEVCYTCRGTKSCHVCGGTGIYSNYGSSHTCGACNGTGTCYRCGGTGKEKTKK
ncbi:MAG: hypothetical protein ACOYMB_02205 [Patescibacteria group bacterium]